MANTYTLIASSTVGSGGAANITFTSIPSTYTDLLIKISARTLRALYLDSVYMNINGGGGGVNLSGRGLQGNGSAVSSFNDGVNGFVDGDSATASTFGNFEMYIPNYTGSTNKSISTDSVTENNATSANATIHAGLWSNTAAITSLVFIPATANFMQYTTAYLYGISNS